MKRILFVAEAVSLAHVARPFVLAQALDPSRHEIHFAAAARYPVRFSDSRVHEWPLHSITPGDFLAALAAGRPIYSRETLAQYVADDLALLDAVRPDLVIGDFRLSLAVSAPLRRVHYVAITNAHWSPYSTRKRLPFPEHPAGRLFGTRIAGRIFNLIEPFVLARHAAPLNAVRRANGLPSLRDLREAYTWSDTTLYADVPELEPTSALPRNHRYIGPILWAPDLPPPEWWGDLDPSRRCVYATLGSTGQTDVWAAVLAGLSEFPVDVLLATAGRTPTDELPANAKAAVFLPGIEAARRSAFVVCNGGSATAYQALSVGVPVLGIPSNLDQHLTMAAITKAGAGLMVRAENATAASVEACADRLLTDRSFAERAGKVAEWFAAFPATQHFSRIVAELVGE